MTDMSNRFIRRKRIIFSILAVLIPAVLRPGFAGITLDGTLGPQRSLTGPDFSITADMGIQRGSNLFHSFSQFSVHTGESAAFSGPDSISAIICRVTGNDPSVINGPIVSGIAQADLYLFNPGGIVFGSGASLDIKGSFHTGTADYLTFSDQGSFNAAAPENSRLTAAPPEAFGFLEHTAAGIRIDSCTLSVPYNTGMYFSGGCLAMDNAVLDAPAGQIDIRVHEDMSLAGYSRLKTWAEDSDSAGNIHISSRNLSLTDGSYVSGSNFNTSGRGGDITVDVSDTLSISGYYGQVRSGIYSQADEDGDAGNIMIRAGQLVIENHGILATDSSGSGDAGVIDVTAETVDLNDNGAILNNNTGGGNGGRVSLDIGDTLSMAGGGIFCNTSGSGFGSSLQITARDITLSNMSSIYVSTFSDGDAGNLHIEADTLTLLDGSQIKMDAWHTGNLGEMAIAADLIRMSGFGYDDDHLPVRSRLSSQIKNMAQGNGGILDIRTDFLEIADGASIDLSNFGYGTGTALDISADDRVTLTGFSLDDDGKALQSEIICYAYRDGDTGDVTINTGRFDLLDGAQIELNSNYNSGTLLTITASDDILISGYGNTADRYFSSRMFIRTYLNDNLGGIRLDTDRLTITDGGAMDTLAVLTGNGGFIDITANDIRIDGGIRTPDDFYPSGLFTETRYLGDAGDITVHTRNLILTNRAQISTTSLESEGNAGDITIQAMNLALTSGAEITTSSLEGDGDGGDIRIRADNDVLISGYETRPSNYYRASKLSSGTSGNGQAGSIFIEAPNVRIEDGGWILSGNLGSGDGGDIHITAGTLTVAGYGIGYGISEEATDLPEILPSWITTSSDGEGDAGDLFIQVRDMVVSGGGWIDVFSSGAGNSGHLTVCASDQILVSGFSEYSGRHVPSWLSSRTYGSGLGGDISIFCGSLVLDSGGTLTAESRGTNTAGNIFIESDIMTCSDAAVTTGSDEAAGGNVDIRVRDLLYLSGSKITTSVRGGTGSGGNITVDPVFIVLADSDIIANAWEGDGGNICLVSDFFFTDPPSLIEASSELGLDGVIVIDAPDIDLSASFVSLPEFRAVPELARTACGTRDREPESSLVRKGQGSLPELP